MEGLPAGDGIQGREDAAKVGHAWQVRDVHGVERAEHLAGQGEQRAEYRRVERCERFGKVGVGAAVLGADPFEFNGHQSFAQVAAECARVD